MKPNGCMPNNMPMMGMLPCQYQGCPMMSQPQMMTMPQMEMVMPSQLDAMYPKIYYVIYPHVQRHCDMKENNHGMMHEYCEKDIEEMTENIYKDCKKELGEDYDDDDDGNDNKSCDDMSRRRRRRRRGPVRDLISILLIRELIARRRRKPYYGYYYNYGEY